MTRYWIVESGEEWEPSYPCFRTTSKEYAEWYCTEVNKCIDNWETYYVTEEHPVRVCEPEYVLTLGFAFNKQLELVASENYVYEDDQIGYSESLELILVNGTGGSYEACLAHAKHQAMIIWTTI